jgi:hypothetical protein
MVIVKTIKTIMITTNGQTLLVAYTMNLKDETNSNSYYGVTLTEENLVVGMTIISFFIRTGTVIMELSLRVAVVGS